MKGHEISPWTFLNEAIDTDPTHNRSNVYLRLPKISNTLDKSKQ